MTWMTTAWETSQSIQNLSLHISLYVALGTSQSTLLSTPPPMLYTDHLLLFPCRFLCPYPLKHRIIHYPHIHVILRKLSIPVNSLISQKSMEGQLFQSVFLTLRTWKPDLPVILLQDKGGYLPNTPHAPDYSSSHMIIFLYTRLYSLYSAL